MDPSRSSTMPPRSSSRTIQIYASTSSASSASSGNNLDIQRQDLGGERAGLEATGALFSSLGGGRDSTNASAASAGAGGGDEEGLGLLRQQLSAVQRIRMEHERKDATIAALRLEVSHLVREREKALDLEHEHNGLRLRMSGMEERCRQLEIEERDSSARWTRKEDLWREQLRDTVQHLAASQEQCRAERDRAEELAALKAELEPALRAALAEASASTKTAEREEAARIKTELRARTVTDSLSVELETARAGAHDLEERVRLLERDLGGARDASARLSSRVESLEEVNERLRAEVSTARSRCTEAELELAQLQVFRPLVERADAIDRQRAEAEEGLMAARAELGREKASLAAAVRNAAEMQAALDRKGKRLEQVEAEASKVLSLERDLLSATCRLDAAEAEKANSARALQDAGSLHRTLVGFVDELAELAAEVLSPPPLARASAASASPTLACASMTAASDGTGRIERGGDGDISARRGTGGDGALGGGAIARLASLEAALRRRGGGGRDGSGGAVEGERGGGASAVGESELRRAVRAVRALAEARATATAECGWATDKLSRAQEELRLLRASAEALRAKEKHLTDVAEKEAAAHAALLPRLRDAQVRRDEADAAANKARLELRDTQDFLASLASAFASRQQDGDETGLGTTEGRWDTGKQMGGTKNPEDDTAGRRRLIAAVSAGVKALVEGRTAVMNACRDLEKRWSQGKREAEELTRLAEEREIAHRQQLEELRAWCETEVDKQRKGKKAAQTAAEKALDSLAAALRRISTLENERTRISDRMTTMNNYQSSLIREAAAAKSGLRLLARACVPLLERCRSLAAQKRLLSRLEGGLRLSADHERIEMETTTGARAMPDASLFVDGLRSLVAALSREGAAGDDFVESIAGRPSTLPGWLGGVSVASQGRTMSGGDVSGDGPRGAVRGMGARGDARLGIKGAIKMNRQREHCDRQSQTSLVSLRAVGIAVVAAERFRKLAALRAAARAAEATLTISLETVVERRDEAPPSDDGGGTWSRARQRNQQRPLRRLPRGFSPSGDVIPLGRSWRGRGGGVWGEGGVAMLSDADVRLLTSPTALAEGTEFAFLLAPSAPETTEAAAVAAVAAVPTATAGGSAVRFLRLLDALVSSYAGVGTDERTAARTNRAAAFVDGDTCTPTLLQVLAEGQVGHWRRLEGRGLVNLPVQLRSGTSGNNGGGAGGCGGIGASGDGCVCRVAASRFSRHRGGTLQQRRASKRKQEEEEALRLLEVTRRGTAALARCAGEAEDRLLESEARRLRMDAELEAALGGAKVLREDLNKKAELISFLEERVRSLEAEAVGTVPAAALVGTERLLAEAVAELETLRVKSASLEAHVAEASARQKKDARRARKGAETACKEQAVRAQLQDELLSLRSYVLRSEETVQELQEEARRQAREAGLGRGRDEGDGRGDVDGYRLTIST